MVKSIKTFALLWLGLLIFYPTLSWAETVVTATLDKTRGSLEDVFLLKVNVEGSSREGDIEIPKIENLEIQSRGKSQQIQFVNGQVSRFTEYTFVLIPQKEGAYKIPALSVTTKGSVKKSQPLSFTVQKSAIVDKTNRDIYLHAQLDKEVAYVGEQVIYTLEFFHRINASSAQLDRPDFSGFSVDQLGEQKESERVIAGKRFRVSRIQYVLFPGQSGELKISPAKITYEAYKSDPNDPFNRFGFFRGGKRVRGQVISSQLTLNVRPIPQVGRPQSFSGLVGKFELKSEISKKDLRVGESVTLTLTLRGIGNVRQMPDLNFKETLQGSHFQKDFKVYDDKPVLNIRSTERGLLGEKTFKKALVPQHAGELSIPPISLSYFDSEKEEFTFLRAEEYTISSKPSGEGEPLVATGGSQRIPRKREIEVLGEDLMPIHVKLRGVKNDALSSRTRVVFAGGTFFPPLFFLFIWAFRQNRERKEKNVDLLRSRGAYREALKNLKTLSLPKGHKNQDHKVFYSELAKHLRMYIGAKLAVSGMALTAKESGEIAQKNGAKEREAKQLEMILGRCEEAQFGTLAKIQDPAEIIRASKNLLKILEKTLRLKVIIE